MGAGKTGKSFQKGGRGGGGGSSNSSPYSKAGQLLNQIWQKQQEQQHRSNHKHSSSSTTSSSGSLGGLKAVAYTTNGEMNCSKTTYAQCANVLKYKPLLDEIVIRYNNNNNNTNKKKQLLLLESNIKNQGLFHVLLYELLLGPNHSIRGGGVLKRTLMTCHKELESIRNQFLQETKHPIIQQYNDNMDTTNLVSKNKSIIVPRYVRINTVQSNLTTVVQGLQKQLQEQQQQASTTTKTQQEQQDSSSNQEQIFLDRHVPNLLVLPPTPETRAMLQESVQSQQIVLQDKSSCFSALCLVHGFDNEKNDCEEGTTGGGDCLDACAAPGNKTSHLAALIAEQQQQKQQAQTSNKDIINHPTKKKKKKQDKEDDSNSRGEVVVHALDRSPERFESLQRRMTELINTPSSSSTTTTTQKTKNKGSVRVECHKLDFLTTSQKDFPNVTRLLLDPSCSGSGMAHHRNNGTTASTTTTTEPSTSQELQRVQNLASFQLVALKHAMTKFEKVTQIVYSTCSLYQQENELVVLQAMREVQQEQQEEGDQEEEGSKEYDTWELIAPRCLQHWHRRGVMVEGFVTEQDAKTMIRVDPSAGDETNGFFVACLQRRRRRSSENNKKGKRSIQTETKEIDGGDEEEYRILDGMRLPIYKGEFQQQQKSSVSKEGEDDDENENDDIDIDVVPSSRSKKKKRSEPNKSNKGSMSQPVESAEEVDDSATPATTTTMAATSTAVDPTKKLGKKRAKKLAWKAKQSEKKRRRLEKNPKETEEK